MAGTKMNLRRYGGGITQNWDEQEIIVDQVYIDSGRGLYIALDYEYAMGTSQLDVYVNGQHLLEGGGYEEVNNTTIRLDLGVYEGDTPLAGQPVQLHVGDEIYIRNWKQSVREGTGSIDELRFKQLEDEVRAARKYKDGEQPYPNLDTRLDSIERRMETKTMVFVLSRVFDGIAKLNMRFPYEGDIMEVYASASSVGADDTSFLIERCTQDSYDTGLPEWDTVTTLVIDANEHSSRTSDRPYSVPVPRIAKDEHFRINVVERGEGIEGVTIELVVKLR
ncbi:hypothetical protein [Paenibacillus sp. NPDC058177]|uniref:hypothetical protein n=1 Tax=Paenibacillus sp. NPDC058177 TaxID=3346369 RepID=UPI0036D87FA2